MAIAVVRTGWSGTSGGPGVTQTYVRDSAGAAITDAQAQSAVNAVRAFWDSVDTFLPNDISLNVSPMCDVYNEVNGELIASSTAATPPTVVTGQSAGAYAMAAGFKVNLNTFTIKHGRRVRGSIYVVPCTTTSFTDNGLVATATRTAINTAGATLLTALNTGGMSLIVFNRPQKNSAGVVTRNGDYSLVTALEVNEKVAVLRGRRD